ncbi:MAG: flagellar basal body rod protein FlgB [Deltaproteobacteria bacterium]|nr:flagellar basal body rod protein FlgB [Deltaproteobacteria bacterium]
MSNLFMGVDALTRTLDYHLERHNVLASNIANVNTPGFRPMELVRETERAAGHQPPLIATDERHFSAAPAGGGPGEVVVREDQAVRPGADGNSVSLERESAKIAANDIRYEGAVKIVAHSLAMLRYAANDGSGQ